MKEVSDSPHNLLFMTYALYGGGAEKVCCILASEFAKECNVTVAYYSPEDTHYPLDPRCELVQIPHNGHRKWNIPGKLIDLYQMVKRYRSIKKEKNIDVSFSLLFHPNLYNVLSARGERVICSERANPKKYLAKWFPLTKYQYAKADHVVFQSKMVQDLYSERIRAHSSIIMNPVSVPCVASDVRSKRIVTLGRLTEQKNYTMLIRSFADFSELFPDYTLSIYGEGEQRGELEELIRDKKLQQKVLLHGNVRDVHYQIRDAEIFVLASNFEGLSNALLECMTMGIACISTKCEGSTDVIRDGENGLLVDIGDQTGLTHALCRLAEDPAFRKSLELSAMKDAEEFQIDVVIKKWREIFFEEETAIKE